VLRYEEFYFSSVNSETLDFLGLALLFLLFYLWCELLAWLCRSSDLALKLFFLWEFRGSESASLKLAWLPLLFKWVIIFLTLRLFPMFLSLLPDEIGPPPPARWVEPAFFCGAPVKISLGTTEGTSLDFIKALLLTAADDLTGFFLYVLWLFMLYI
jgi:hypothetical protein